MSVTFDPLELVQALGIKPLAAPAPVTGGLSGTGIWRVETAERSYALRVFGPDGSRLCEREAAIMEHVREAGLPVPAVRASGVHDGAPYLLLDWSPGRVISAALTRRPWRARALGQEFGLTQARLHQLTAPDALRAAGNWYDWPVRPPPALTDRLPELARRLEATSRPDPVVIHLDYHPLNVLTGDGRITGILDWTNSRAGDPRADLARSYTIARYLPGVQGVTLAIARRVFRMFIAGWWAGYRSVAGPQAEMPLFLAWAGHAMIDDLEPKRSMPGMGMESAYLDSLFKRVQDDIARWERMAGLA